LSRELICPIRDGKCLGRDCAMSVMLDHPNVSTHVVWKCGLSHDADFNSHAVARTIDRMTREEWRSKRWA